MRKFHGDLLMGGLALRQIDGVIDEEDVEPDHHNEGHFEVDAEKLSILELGRPYLLMCDDGESMKLVVKELKEKSDYRRLVVQFESISPPFAGFERN